MIRRCLGWTKPRHEPLILGEVAPFADMRYTDGVCDDCLRAPEYGKALLNGKTPIPEQFKQMGIADLVRQTRRKMVRFKVFASALSFTVVSRVMLPMPWRVHLMVSIAFTAALIIWFFVTGQID